MRTSNEIKTYSKLITLPTWNERLAYLQLDSKVGEATFGKNRFLNQDFYHRSSEWKKIRNNVIIRDMGCDLGVEGMDIVGNIYIHHMNPVDEDDILDWTEFLTDPEYLICVSHKTHNLIHYVNTNVIVEDYKERKPNDTCPWK